MASIIQLDNNGLYWTIKNDRNCSKSCFDLMKIALRILEKLLTKNKIPVKVYEIYNYYGKVQTVSVVSS